MAHLVDSLSYSGQTPWHGLGRRLPSNVTGEDMIRFAGLDWEVIPRPLTADMPDGSLAPVAGHIALTRSDRNTVLSVVSDRYGIIQNREALTLLDAAVGEGSAVYHVAGSLDEGRQVFLLAEVATPGHTWTVKGEEMKPYLLLSTGHDATRALTCMFTAVRVVCNNTLSVALSDDASPRLSIRHTKNAAERVRQAAHVIAQARTYFRGFSERALALAAQELTTSRARELTDALFPAVKVDGKLTVTPGVEKARAKVVALFDRQGDSTDRRIAGTAWGYFNAVAAYTDHNVNRRGGDDGRMRAILLDGQAQGIKQRALELLAA